MPIKDFSKLPITVCLTCGKEFKRPSSGTGPPKYCCVECYSVSVSKRQLGDKNHMWNGGKREIICKQCGKIFRQHKSKADRQFCSYNCYLGSKGHGAAKKEIKCPTCGNLFENKYDMSRARKYCSPECHRKMQSMRQFGSGSHFWQGGKVHGVRRLRNHPLYAEWRKNVFERDGYRCQICGVVGGRLVAHHLVPVSENPRKALRLSNGATLCWNCHADIHWPERRCSDG